MAQLLADENFPLPVTQELRALGHEVVTIQDLERSDQRLPDGSVLQARAHGPERGCRSVAGFLRRRADAATLAGSTDDARPSRGQSPRVGVSRPVRYAADGQVAVKRL